MTTNQWRAAVLAAEVCRGRVNAADLADADWDLLLLAADLNNPLSLPLLVCHRVLDRASRGVGYFEGATPGACPITCPAAESPEMHARPNLPMRHTFRADAAARRICG